MSLPAPHFISSRDNAFVKDLRRLSQDSTAYRKLGQVWLEGDHLCRAALTRGLQPAVSVISESFRALPSVEWSYSAIKTVVLPDRLFADISALGSPAPMGFLVDLPADVALVPDAATVILDRVQDAGNVGAILRSASAFGFRQIIALKGTAALWSPKVLRAGMGAHWGLQLIEGTDLALLGSMQLPLLVTSSHQGRFLHDLLQARELPAQCSWALGHEGQGVSDALQTLASQWVRIAQPGGEESLNVASAAAICLHASASAGLLGLAGKP